jgi:hypothetical protein
VDNKDDDVGSKTEGAICSPRKVYSPKSCRSHGMRNEMHIRLKWLHRLVQCSGFFLIRDQKYPCLMEGGELGRMLSSQITDELKLVAHPVGLGLSGNPSCPQPKLEASFGEQIKRGNLFGKQGKVPVIDVED